MKRRSLVVCGVEFRPTLIPGVRAGELNGRVVLLQNYGRGAFPWAVRAHGGRFSMIFGRGRTAADAVSEALASDPQYFRGRLVQ